MEQYWMVGSRLEMPRIIDMTDQEYAAYKAARKIGVAAQIGRTGWYEMTKTNWKNGDETGVLLDGSVLRIGDRVIDADGKGGTVQGAFYCPRDTINLSVGWDHWQGSASGAVARESLNGNPQYSLMHGITGTVRGLDS